MAPTTPPAGWPAADLIRVVKGYGSGVGLIHDRLAMRDVAGSYRLLGGGLLCPGTVDVIKTWEEMTAVPVAALADLQEAFEGMDGHSPALPREGLGGPQTAAVRAVLACLPES